MVDKREKLIPCVIPCGGTSTRMDGKNKCLLPICGKPLLYYVVSFWLPYTDNFIFITADEETSKTAKNLVPEATIIDRKDRLNLVGAISLAQPYIEDRFILALGDCLNVGKFIIPLDIDLGVGVCLESIYELRKNYLVSIGGQLVSGLIEKPKSEVGLCGMGTLFLHKKIFDYADRLKLPNQTTSVDLTGMLQVAIGAGERILPIYFKGSYINITYPEDLQMAEELLKWKRGISWIT